MSSLLGLLAVALGLRLAFVAWAPGEATGDGIFYHQLALDLMQGNGYLHFDRSPANTWGPGWPGAFATLLYLFGDEAVVGMWANAVLGAITTLLVVRLGFLLFEPRVALIGGWLYALWPSMIYFSATVMREPFFNLILVTCLIVLLETGRATSRQRWMAGGVGAMTGFGALVRDETILLLLPMAAYLFAVRRSPREAAAMAGLMLVCAAAVILPWTLRNYREFDRFILTSAGSGLVLYVANHPGATGGHDLRAIIDYLAELDAEDLSQAEQNLLMLDEAPGRVARFMLEEPGEALAIMANKLVIIYGADSASAELVRGYFGPKRWHLAESTWRRLALVANAWWISIVLLTIVGISGVRRWRSDVIVLLLGLQLVYLTLHLVFVASPRAHTSETLWIALIAGSGVVMLQDRWRARAGT